MQRTTRSPQAQPFKHTASRWTAHVAQVHSAERAAINAALCSGVSPAQYTVRKLEDAPHAARVLESQRAPAQLSLFSKHG
jgi:hypothetical protein